MAWPWEGNQHQAQGKGYMTPGLHNPRPCMTLGLYDGISHDDKQEYKIRPIPISKPDIRPIPISKSVDVKREAVE